MLAVILDDERNSAESLLLLLQRHCPEVCVVAVETDPEQALKVILQLRPDLLFLDIEFQTSNAFQLLDFLDYSPGIIFVTAYDKYALKAIKIDAFEYLLKPVSAFELIKAVEKARGRLQIAHRDQQTDIRPVMIERIAVPTSDGLMFLRLSEVIRLEADGSYTKVVQTNGSPIIISKHLGAVEQMTQSANFFRVHKSHIINLEHLIRYFRGEGGEVLLSDNSRLPVSRDRKDDFLEAIKRFPNTGRI